MNTELVRQYLPEIMTGFGITVALAALVLGISLPLAFAVALCRHLRVRFAAPVCTAFVQTFRALPALIVLYFTFYGLPSLGVVLQPFSAALLGMTLTASAYLSEDVRASLSSIPPGQWDAARALGCPLPLTLRRVIMPQAWPVLVPPLLTNAIIVLKATAIASLVGVRELTGASLGAMAVTYSATDFLMLAAILYLAMTGVLAGLQAVLEARLRRRAAAWGGYPYPAPNRCVTSAAAAATGPSSSTAPARSPGGTLPSNASSSM